MKNSKFIRLLSLCLALVCLLTLATAAAAEVAKTTVWDLQKAVSAGETTSYAAILTDILGGPDELHPNKDNVYEIHSSLGLYKMANVDTEGKTFKLMNALDMSGKSWNPVAGFKGTFDGNGKTITGLSVKSSASNVGLFADVQAGATVKDLTLENVTVTVSGNAKYVGAIAGTNAGAITNVNVIGTITDTRAADAADEAYYGVVAGKCEATGTITGGTAVSIKDGAEKYETSGLCADIKLNTNIAGAKKGIAAETAEGASVTGFYCDTTNSTKLLSSAEQARRQTVVDNMYQQGTVKWTTSETVYYTRNDATETTHSNAFVAGRTYTGIPYNHGAGSMERFMSQMQADTDAQGRLVTVTGLEHATYDNRGDVTTNTGFAQYMGTDCSSAISWAWAAVSAGRTEDNYPGVFLHTCRYMVPNPYNTTKYGVQVAGGYQLPESTSSTGADARNTRNIITLNGTQGIAEAYAKSHRGDALLYNLTSDEDFSNEAGHARMLAEDPVVIRAADGSIDLEKSYVITHEQGDGLTDRKDQDGNYISDYETINRPGSGYFGWLFQDTYKIKYTSWRINHKYTFSVLLTEEGYNAATAAYNNGDQTQKPGCGWGYIPITMQAFTTPKTSYFNEYGGESALTAPNSGKIYCNYRIISATMFVKDAEGNVVYDQTRYQGVGETGGIYRSNHLTADMSVLFSDSVNNCTEGQTYTFSISMLLSNGENKTFTRKATGESTFTYTHTVAEPAA